MEATILIRRKNKIFFPSDVINVSGRSGDQLSSFIADERIYACPAHIQAN